MNDKINVEDFVRSFVQMRLDALYENNLLNNYNSIGLSEYFKQLSDDIFVVKGAAINYNRVNREVTEDDYM